MRKHQRGITFFGATFVGLVLVSVAILLMKLVPPYLEFWSVQKIIGVIGKDPSLPNMSPAEIRNTFTKRSIVDTVNVISASDLEISKGPGGTVVTAHYSVTVPIVANISALLEFNASTAGSGGGQSSKF